ncbi:MAG: YggT family protein [Magnetovibrionaceae bacterium]
MSIVGGPFLWLITTVIDIYMWIVIIGVILSWLVAFQVINTSNRFVYMIGDFVHRATEPALRPLRNILPNLGGIDLAPMALILILIFSKQIIINVFLAVSG